MNKKPIAPVVETFYFAKISVDRTFQIKQSMKSFKIIALSNIELALFSWSSYLNTTQPLYCCLTESENPFLKSNKSWPLLDNKSKNEFSPIFIRTIKSNDHILVANLNVPAISYSNVQWHNVLTWIETVQMVVVKGLGKKDQTREYINLINNMRGPLIL